MGSRTYTEFCQDANLLPNHAANAQCFSQLLALKGVTADLTAKGNQLPCSHSKCEHALLQSKQELGGYICFTHLGGK